MKRFGTYIFIRIRKSNAYTCLTFAAGIYVKHLGDKELLDPTRPPVQELLS